MTFNLTYYLSACYDQILLSARVGFAEINCTFLHLQPTAVWDFSSSLCCCSCHLKTQLLIQQGYITLTYLTQHVRDSLKL